MDGFETAALLREHARCPEKLVMMLTAVDERRDVARCREAGIAQWLVKPLFDPELSSALLSALGKSVEVLPHEERGAAMATAPVSACRVLLAEDNAVNQLLAVAMLKKLGHGAVVAQNGREALAILGSSRSEIDLVLMDVQMPEMDGLAATAAIRADERVTGEHLPIVALTAHAMKGDRERCLEAGMDDYLPKPLVLSELADAITRNRRVLGARAAAVATS
jgi:CheY-like chemotaxis protein